MGNPYVHRHDVYEDVYEDDNTPAKIDYHRHNHRHDVYGITKVETLLINSLDEEGTTDAAAEVQKYT